MTRGAIIVGAGPVGLMLAGELTLAGVDVAIYEKLGAPSGESRGVGFTRRAAEVFDQRGLLDRFGEVEWAQGHFGGVRIDFTKLEENHFSVRGIPQFRTEEMLAGWLTDLGVPIRRGHEVVEIRQTEDDVRVVFDGPDGRGEDTAHYLVGCDGGRSIVRQQAGIEFPGWAATRGMLMADVVGAEIRPRPIGERVPGGMVMAMHLEDGVVRVVIHEEGISPLHSKENLTFGEVADAWERMTGESLHGERHRWASSFTNAFRQAATYRLGRVFVAGDAAHVHLPAGAQGLGVGVQDAVNLGWKLGAAINGWAPEGLLDTYHSERHPVGQRLLCNTRAQGALYLGGDELDPLRTVLRELVDYPVVANYLASMVSGLEIQYDMGVEGPPLVGRRMPPDTELDLRDGHRVRVANLLRSARGVLVTTGHDVGQAGGWADRVDVVAGTWVDGGRAAPPEAVLMRPDGYVAWASGTETNTATNTETSAETGLDTALTRWFGVASTAEGRRPAA
jgi:2-polyprenyl-6-methoxyphenol hydroxylase-like FAD-dependent oxidoreductase